MENKTENELIGIIDAKNGGEDVRCIFDVKTIEYEPHELPGLAKDKSTHTWYFFAPYEKKGKHEKRKGEHEKGKGEYVKRKVKDKGYWKSNGKATPVKGANGEVIGRKKYLTFQERTPEGHRRTSWIMHEYHSFPKPKNAGEEGESSKSSTQATVASENQSNQQKLQTTTGMMHVSNGGCQNASPTVYVIQKLIKTDVKKEGGKAGRKRPRDTITDGTETWEKGESSGQATVAPRIRSSHHQPRATAGVTNVYNGGCEVSQADQVYGQNPMGTPKTWEVVESNSQAAVASETQSSHLQLQPAAGSTLVSNGGCENAYLADQMDNAMETPQVITSQALGENGGTQFYDDMLAEFELLEQQEEEPPETTQSQEMENQPQELVEYSSRIGSDTLPGASDLFGAVIDEDFKQWAMNFDEPLDFGSDTFPGTSDLFGAGFDEDLPQWAMNFDEPLDFDETQSPPNPP